MDGIKQILGVGKPGQTEQGISQDDTQWKAEVVEIGKRIEVSVAGIRLNTEALERNTNHIVDALQEIVPSFKFIDDMASTLGEEFQKALKKQGVDIVSLIKDAFGHHEKSILGSLMAWSNQMLKQGLDLLRFLKFWKTDEDKKDAETQDDQLIVSLQARLSNLEHQQEGSRSRQGLEAKPERVRGSLGGALARLLGLGEEGGGLMGAFEGLLGGLAATLGVRALLVTGQGLIAGLAILLVAVALKDVGEALVKSRSAGDTWSQTFDKMTTAFLTDFFKAVEFVIKTGFDLFMDPQKAKEWSDKLHAFIFKGVSLNIDWGAVATTILGVIWSGVKASINVLNGVMAQMAGMVKDEFKQIDWNSVVQALLSLTLKGLQAAVDWIINMGPSVAGNIITGLKAATEELMAANTAVLSDISSALVKGLGTLFSVAQDKVDQWTESSKALLNPLNWGKALYEAIEQHNKELRDNFDKKKAAVDAAHQKLWDDLTKYVEDHYGITALVQLEKNVTDKTEHFWDTIKDSIGSWYTWMTDWASSFFSPTAWKTRILRHLGLDTPGSDNTAPTPSPAPQTTLPPKFQDRLTPEKDQSRLTPELAPGKDQSRLLPEDIMTPAPSVFLDQQQDLVKKDTSTLGDILREKWRQPSQPAMNYSPIIHGGNRVINNNTSIRQTMGYSNPTTSHSQTNLSNPGRYSS